MQHLLRRTLHRSVQYATVIKANNYIISNIKNGMLLLFLLCIGLSNKAQVLATKADSLRGSLNANRTWWNVLHYNLQVTPHFEQKTIEGKVAIQLKAITSGSIMQIDLQKPMQIDSILEYPETGKQQQSSNTYTKHQFTQTDNIAIVQLNTAFQKNSIHTLHIYYHGKPKEAKKAPWDGGWIWKQDAKGRPWMSLAVQGLGASSWYPCKDHQSDEPDNGASITIIVPDTLVAVGNGIQTQEQTIQGSSTKAYTWQVKNPINNYCIVPYIGAYTTFSDTFMGEKGILSLKYYVLDYQLEKAKKQFSQVKSMLHCFEYWFGAYPFYEDGYKLVEAPHLGMEHQSAIAYGNGYKNGYLGIDLSGSGWGLQWDFIIVHESGHEWFANNITTKDIADMWVHEGFTNYSETLYTQWLLDKEAAYDYCVGLRKRIANDIPIIGKYGINKEGSGDMYYKASNMIHNIRNIIANDTLFRKILRGLNTHFYHKTVSTADVEQYIIHQSGINFQQTFDQYLRTTQIPELQYFVDPITNKLAIKWSNCMENFDMPITIASTQKRLQISTSVATYDLKKEELEWFTQKNIERYYYLKTKPLSSMP
ncbi:MAG: M1 family metallopeptidase [Chitinophagaceae bacterium]